MDRRAFVTLALCNGAWALAGRAFAAARIDGSVTRLPDRAKVRVAWSDAGEPALVVLLTNPDAPAVAGKTIKLAATDGAVEIEAPASPRPYFLVSTRSGGQARLAERLLPLEGGRNFRDLGGYRVEDGRQVRWGRIYRSGVMSGLTAGDIDYLRKLGVSTICDLRNTLERTDEPSPFLKTPGAEVVVFDYDMASNLEGLARLKTRDEAIAGFAAAYVGFLDMLRPHYTAMFGRLVKGDAPLAMNCSAGKDRTGMGSALVLSVLGVPRETVIADYALTAVYTPPSGYVNRMVAGGRVSGVTAEQAQALGRMPREALEVVMGADPEVMRQALALVDQTYGSPIALAKARFGLTDDGVARMRRLYLI